MYFTLGLGGTSIMTYSRCYGFLGSSSSTYSSDPNGLSYCQSYTPRVAVWESHLSFASPN